MPRLDPRRARPPTRPRLAACVLMGLLSPATASASVSVDGILVMVRSGMPEAMVVRQISLQGLDRPLTEADRQRLLAEAPPAVVRATFEAAAAATAGPVNGGGPRDPRQPAPPSPPDERDRSVPEAPEPHGRTWPTPEAVSASAADAAPDSKTALLAGGNTQKKYERKAALATTRLGLGAAHVRAPVTACVDPKEGKTRCSGQGRWRYDVSPDLRSLLAKDLYDWVVTQRLDKILLHDGRAEMRLGAKTVAASSDRMAGFRFDTGSLASFRGEAERWLSQNAGPAVGDILQRSVRDRYQRLPDQERGTFLRDVAKTVGVPPSMVRKLMHSAYAFFIHLGSPQGSVRVTRRTKEVRRGKEKVQVTVWDTRVGVAVKATVLIYQYDPTRRRFDFYKSFRGESGGSVSTSKEFSSPPSPKGTAHLLRRSLRVATKAAGIDLNTQLKGDDRFAIVFTADSVDGDEVGGNVGVLEDIRMDAPMRVSRTIDGEDRAIGFVKAREVAHNCDEPAMSRFEVVRGDVDLGDQLREHPWTGLMIGPRAGSTHYELFEWDRREAYGGGRFQGAGISTRMDLGYVLNSPSMSEVWMDMGFDLGFGGDPIDVGDGDGRGGGGGGTVLVSAALGLARRLHLGSTGVFVSPGVDLGFMAMSSTDSGDNTTRTVGSAVAVPVVRLTYGVSPNFELQAHAGWATPLSAQGWAQFGDGDPTEFDVVVHGGPRMGVGLIFHLPVVGSLASMYTKPSKVCEQPPRPGESPL